MKTKANGFRVIRQYDRDYIKPRGLMSHARTRSDPRRNLRLSHTTTSGRQIIAQKAQVLADPGLDLSCLVAYYEREPVRLVVLGVPTHGIDT